VVESLFGHLDGREEQLGGCRHRCGDDRRAGTGGTWVRYQRTSALSSTTTMTPSPMTSMPLNQEFTLGGVLWPLSTRCTIGIHCPDPRRIGLPGFVRKSLADLSPVAQKVGRSPNECTALASPRTTPKTSTLYGTWGAAFDNYAYLWARFSYR